MGKIDRVWRSDVAKKLLATTGASTIQEAIPLLIEKKLTTFEPLKPPVDLRMVASAFGISSHFNYIDMPNAGHLRHDGKTYVIDVNIAHNPQRQRFSIAHEIGLKHSWIMGYTSLNTEPVPNILLRSAKKKKFAMV